MKNINRPMKVQTARATAINNAMAHNKYLTERYLRNLSDEELICWVHPRDRDQLRVALKLKISTVSD